MLLALFSAMPASGVVLSEEKKVFSSSPCRGKAGCVDTMVSDPIEFGFWVRQLLFPKDQYDADDSDFYTSKLYMWYETNGHATVEDFVFVQRQRGCMFSSVKEGAGDVTTHYNFTHQHLGARSIYLHQDWTTDSPIADPVWTATGEFPEFRHYVMEWGVAPEKFPDKIGNYYGVDPPKETRLHTTAEPSLPARVFTEGTRTTAWNHSFEFKTCLYRASDVPMRVLPGDKEIPGALGCIEWRSSFVYDHMAKKWTSPASIDPVCFPKTTPDINKPW